MTPADRWRVRRTMAKWCEWGIAHEGSIHYAQVRPMPLPVPGTLPLTTDCSGLATLFAKWAGAPDPSGFGFNGSGNSASIARHQRQIFHVRDLHKGDYVVFGNPATTHVAAVIQRGRTPETLTLMSHGMERGPLRITLANEAAYHQGEGGFRFYSLIHPRKEK